MFILALLAVCLLPAMAVGLLPATAMGHPHVFVDSELSFVFDGQGLAGIRQRWVFDEMFSAQIMDMVDTDGDGRLSEAESHKTEREAFVNLNHFNYFTHVSVDGRPVTFARATDFRATCKADILIYEFFLPCPVPMAAGVTRTVRVAVYDQSYYTDLMLVKGKPGLAGSEGHAVDLRVRDAAPVRTEWGPIMPKEVLLTLGAK